jgi:hypothetical protein
VIGIDFDNTIVCYDEVFGRVAVEQGLVPPHVATSKTAIRDHLRSIAQEDRWTELQGTIYGQRIMDAPPFPGVVDFFAACRESGIRVAIVSHRTRFPYLGERHDLHAAARDWLARHGFHDPDRVGLPVDRVFLEETKEAKLARIAALGCTHFIDDLPELLADPRFPAAVQPILFDPHRQHGAPRGVEIATSWTGLRAIIGRTAAPSAAIAKLFTSAGLAAPLAVERLAGGGNNRTYRVETAAGPVLLKEYFRHPSDARDRLGAEQAFSRFAHDHGVRSLPRPLACDREAGLAVYEFIPGRTLGAGAVSAAHVDEAAAFFAAINRHRHEPAAVHLPTASEACFTLAEHLARVDRRLARLAAIETLSELHVRAASLVATRLAPAWKRVRAAVAADEALLDAPLAAADRVLSPSDFGFHNCIVTPTGLTFVDFEYAGWDDPAKTVCDFFCQPAVPVPREHLERFLAAVAAASGSGQGLRDRVALLLPVYELKWCCIMLNEFLPVGDERRAFARADERHDDRPGRLGDQLRKVEATLARLGA